jgi:hypothetical protein
MVEKGFDPVQFGKDPEGGSRRRRASFLRNFPGLRIDPKQPFGCKTRKNDFDPVIFQKHRKLVAKFVELLRLNFHDLVPMANVREIVPDFDFMKGGIGFQVLLKQAMNRLFSQSPNQLGFGEIFIIYDVVKSFCIHKHHSNFSFFDYTTKSFSKKVKVVIP